MYKFSSVFKKYNAGEHPSIKFLMTGGLGATPIFNVPISFRKIRLEYQLLVV